MRAGDRLGAGLGWPFPKGGARHEEEGQAGQGSRDEAAPAELPQQPPHDRAQDQAHAAPPGVVAQRHLPLGAFVAVDDPRLGGRDRGAEPREDPDEAEGADGPHQPAEEEEAHVQGHDGAQHPPLAQAVRQLPEDGGAEHDADVLPRDDAPHPDARRPLRLHVERQERDDDAEAEEVDEDRHVRDHRGAQQKPPGHAAPRGPHIRRRAARVRGAPELSVVRALVAGVLASATGRHVTGHAHGRRTSSGNEKEH